MINPDRAAYIIECELKMISSIKVGEDLGISRERVRQIFTKATGRGYGQTKRDYYANERVRKLIKVVSYCLNCHTPIRRISGKRKFCSDQCRLIYSSRNHKVTNQCVYCSKDFHPLRNVGCPSNRGTGEFCSRRCYLLSGRFPTLLKKIHKDCQMCGKSLGEVSPRQKFCSECFRKRVNDRVKAHYWKNRDKCLAYHKRWRQKKKLRAIL